jgi:hypothetical protein
MISSYRWLTLKVKNRACKAPYWSKRSQFLTDEGGENWDMLESVAAEAQMEVLEVRELQ